MGMERQTEWILLKPTIIIMAAAYIPWFLIVKYELLAKFYRLLLVWSFILLAYGLYKYLIWLLNVNLITNKRVINVKYFSLINKKISEAPINNIMNISFHSKGLFASLFNFGTVDIQLANVTEPIKFDRVRAPQVIKDMLWELKNTHS